MAATTIAVDVRVEHAQPCQSTSACLSEAFFGHRRAVRQIVFDRSDTLLTKQRGLLYQIRLRRANRWASA